MPRPDEHLITLTIDGREVSAVENSMLVDAAKRGDIEIPFFCYEPKLGNPVGACRMCLVEIEGIPKLQVACATPVKDGMVVHTQSARAKEAQRGVVEFLLINHPLDCPVCDRGGECPLQDITMGWGAGTSRFVEPKRHFRKPLELSPLIAIDRERCILCYRCVRFSQEVSEDYQLILHERGADSFVGTFDGHPYVAPFSGNIIELCPVGALTSRPYRFRARPWDIEGSASVCTLCPAQCNVDLTVRDDRVLRVLERHNEEVDDGWLCDKGRFAYQALTADERVVEPLMRDGDELHPVSWEQALDAAASGLGRAAGGRAAALAGAGATGEEGLLLGRLMREALGSPHLDSRSGGELGLGLARALSAPGLAASVVDLEFAHAVLVLDCEPIDDAPIIDLRLRKGHRRRGMRLVVAGGRPSTLDPTAELSLRIAPGGGEALLAALDHALVDGDAASLDELAGAAGLDAEAVRGLATLLRYAGEDVVIVYGERLLAGERAPHAARALLNVAERLGLVAHGGAGLLELPGAANGRGLREAGVLPDAGPGYAELPDGVSGRGHAQIAAGLGDGELGAIYLLGVDPLRDLPNRGAWKRALHAATTVVCHAPALTETVREHATIVFPAESYAEKQGTVVHPDGRLQRLGPAIGRPPGVRPEWWVLAELAGRLDCELGVATGADATAQLIDAVPFYAGLDAAELGGSGTRWTEREPASALAAGEQAPFALERPAPAPAPNGALRLGTFRSLWAGAEVELSPALRFLAPDQRLELSPADAKRLGLSPGDRVAVRAGEVQVQATVLPRAAMPDGAAFLAEAVAAHPDGASDSANVLLNGAPRLVSVQRLS